MNTPKRPAAPRPRRSKFSTSDKSSNIKLNRSLSDRWKARRTARATSKAAYLSTLPKEPWKRLLYRLHPKRVAQYWFSREGAIMALKITGISIIAMFLLVIGLFAYFRKDLPKINDISGDKIGGSNVYYDRTGQTVLWQDNDTVRRLPVKGSEISDNIRNATVAIEDKDFYKHGAFDVRGIMRAGFNDVTGGSTQGGSTITQQLVKLNEQWTNNRTVTRKVKELILAVELEREYSKTDILNAYLNVAPYGGVEYGVESASRDYFGVPAKDLSLTQAAMLAAIPKAPGELSPYSSTQWNPAASDGFNKSALLARMNYILDQMATQHMITQQQANAAKKVDVLATVKPLQSSYSNIKAPYFVQAAKQELINKYGSATVKLGGLKVITTLDMNLQSKAEDLVATNLPKAMRLTGGAADEAATVAEDVPTGQIMALVGGTDFSNPQYGQRNYASSILIPPGSSFKPYDYTTLIENNNNVGAGSVLYDTQQALKPYYNCDNKARPKDGGNCLNDYDFIYPGPLTLRYALGGSRNVPAVKAMLSAVPNDTSDGKLSSINKVISTASAMMDNPYEKSTYNCYKDEFNTVTAQCYASSAIGDGAFLHLDDHVNGLATLGRLGVAVPHEYILQVDNASAKTIYKWRQPKGKQVVRPDSAYIVDNMASDPNASYLNGSCTATNCTSLAAGGYKFQHDNGSTFAVKTGTTNDGYDGLMTSWSSKYAVVSWVGNHDRHINLGAYSGASMETLTEPMTRGLMEAAHAGKPVATWTAPSDIKSLPSFVVHNHIHYGDIEPSPSNDLYPSWYAGGTKTNTAQVTDKVSGKVSTSCTPELAKNTVTNGNAASWNIDLWNGGNPSVNSGSSGSGSSAAQATDDVHNCSDSPPTVSLTAPDTCGPGSCTITVTASQGTHDLSGGSYTTAPAGTLAVAINGQNVQTFTMDQGGVYSASFSYTPTSSGTASITATVVDSVLYSGSATKQITLATAASFNLSTSGTNPTTFSWTGGTGTVTVYRVGNAGVDSAVCSGNPDSSCSAKVPASTKVYAKDSTGATTPTVTAAAGG